MNYLIIDIGNTNIDFVNFNKLTNKYSNKFTVDTFDILQGRLGSVNKKIKKNYYQGALSSSVVPNAFNKLKKMLKTKNIHLNEIKDRNLDLPIKLKINKPKQRPSRVGSVFHSTIPLYLCPPISELSKIIVSPS